MIKYCLSPKWTESGVLGPDGRHALSRAEVEGELVLDHVTIQRQLTEVDRVMMQKRIPKNAACNDVHVWNNFCNYSREKIDSVFIMSIVIVIKVRTLNGAF